MHRMRATVTLPILLFGLVAASCSSPDDPGSLAFAAQVETSATAFREEAPPLLAPEATAPPAAVLGSASAQAVQDSVTASRSTAIVRAASRVAPGVATISVLSTQQARPRSLWDSFFAPYATERRRASYGSGFVIDAGRGLVLTNEHVIRNAEQVRVTFPDGTDLDAEIVGADALTDVAVLSVDPAAQLPQVPLGTSEGLLIGEWVMAIGNPFGNLISNSEPSVTAGVVSALGRHIVPSENDRSFYLGMIQTDASINPGNSGGPLVNALGQVVGVNSSIFSRSGGSEGLGFAIPIDRALRVAEDLAAQGEVSRAWLGLEVEPAEADAWGRTRGVLISQVVGGSPAQEAGLLAGRRILAADGQPLAGPLDWEEVFLDVRIGQTVELEVEDRPAPVRLQARPLPSMTAERVQALRDIELITVTPQIRSERGLASQEGALVVDISDERSQQLGFRAGDVLVQIRSQRGTFPIASADEAARIFEQITETTGRIRVQIVFERNGSLGVRTLGR
jgi:serine protease Do